MLLEASIRDLIVSTNQIETKFRQHVSDQVQFTMGYQVMQIGDSVVFQGYTSNDHFPKIRVLHTQPDDSTTAVKLVTVAGKSLSIVPIKKTSDVLITCNCEDFVYRFATTNQQHGVLFGSITKPYIATGVRPSQNLGVIGVCKHLIKLVDILTADRILV